MTLALGALAAACGDPETRVVSLQIRVPEQCPEPGRPRYPLQIRALGDFPGSPDAHVSLSDRNADLTLPADTRAVEVHAAGAAFSGIGELVGDRADVLLWPSAAACAFSAPAEYPGPSGGQALGYSSRSGHALLAGGTGDQSVALGALDLDTNTARVVATAARRELRSFATVTDLGGDLVVAGGFDPTSTAAEPADTINTRAEVFSVAQGRFDTAPIDLMDPRARHGSIALDTGDALLVGGLGRDGNLIARSEAISATLRRSDWLGVATLDVARLDPQVLRLDDGRIAIAGGTVLDGGVERPAGTVEWLEPDASRHARPSLELGARFDRSFAALPGGGLLGVGGCEDREPRPDETCSEQCPRRGCPPAGGWDAEWISPEGIAQRFQLEFAAPEPVLIAGADGAPWLSADGAFWRFNPWRVRFERAIDAPSSVPLRVAGPELAVLPLPVAVDAGAFVWLDWDGTSATLRGFRHSTRGRYADDLELVGNTDPLDGLRPLHLVPDRAPTGDPPAARFRRDDLGRPALDLGFGWVVVADTSYLDFDLEIGVEPGPRPIVRVGQTELGGPECPWPEPNDAATETLLLRRRGDAAELVAGDQSRSCSADAERASIAFRSSGAAFSVVRSLTLTRVRSAR